MLGFSVCIIKQKENKKALPPGKTAYKNSGTPEIFAAGGKYLLKTEQAENKTKAQGMKRTELLKTTVQALGQLVSLN